MKRVAGYVRVSRVAGRSGDSFQSPDAQEEAIRAHAKARRLEVVEVVRELDASGGTMARPKLRHLLDEVEAGRLDGIVVARLDRFARTLVGGVQALEAIHAVGGFVQTVEGGIDTSTSGGAMGELQLNLLLTLAQWERATRAEGFAAAKSRAVERGVHIAGTVPVGYLRPAKGARLDLDPQKAPAVREAFELRASGATLGEVARMLDRRLPGGPSGSGAWNRGTVARLLANRAYLGEARQGDYRNPDAHPAIVSADTFATVEALARRREPVKPTSGARSLLAGVCVCGSCGYALDRNKVGSRYWVYRCRGRSASGACEAPVSAMAPALEEHVAAAVLARLASAAVEAVAVDTDVADIHARLAAARGKRPAFENPDYVAQLGVDAALRALARVDEEVAHLEDELAASVSATTGVEPPPVDVQHAADVWPTLTTDERREVIASMVEGVVVSRGVRGAPLVDRVAVYWKGDDLPLARPSRGRRRSDRAEVVAGAVAA
jgi:DNA invertase Pin-like site-specific DNA recombinase